MAVVFVGELAPQILQIKHHVVLRAVLHQRLPVAVQNPLPRSAGTRGLRNDCLSSWPCICLPDTICTNHSPASSASIPPAITTLTVRSRRASRLNMSNINILLPPPLDFPVLPETGLLHRRILQTPAAAGQTARTAAASTPLPSASPTTHCHSDIQPSNGARPRFNSRNSVPSGNTAPAASPSAICAN